MVSDCWPKLNFAVVVVGFVSCLHAGVCTMSNQHSVTLYNVCVSLNSHA